MLLTHPEDFWGLGLIAWGFRVLSTYTGDTNPTKYLIIQNVEILLCTIYYRYQDTLGSHQCLDLKSI